MNLDKKNVNPYISRKLVFIFKIITFNIYIYILHIKIGTKLHFLLQIL